MASLPEGFVLKQNSHFGRRATSGLVPSSKRRFLEPPQHKIRPTSAAAAAAPEQQQQQNTIDNFSRRNGLCNGCGNCRLSFPQVNFVTFCLSRLDFVQTFLLCEKKNCVNATKNTLLHLSRLDFSCDLKTTW
jgi:hypothetical protein